MSVNSYGSIHLSHYTLNAVTSFLIDHPYSMMGVAARHFKPKPAYAFVCQPTQRNHG